MPATHPQSSIEHGTTRSKIAGFEHRMFNILPEHFSSFLVEHRNRVPRTAYGIYLLLEFDEAVTTSGQWHLFEATCSLVLCGDQHCIPQRSLLSVSSSDEYLTNLWRYLISVHKCCDSTLELCNLLIFAFLKHLIKL